MEQLFTIVKTWNIIENNGLYIYDIFDIRLPNCFLETINKYNYHNYNSQIDHIKKTLDIIETQTKLSSLNNAINEQSKFALNWCNKYDIDINYNSSFFK